MKDSFSKMLIATAVILCVATVLTFCGYLLMPSSEFAWTSEILKSFTGVVVFASVVNVLMSFDDKTTFGKLMCYLSYSVGFSENKSHQDQVIFKGIDMKRAALVLCGLLISFLVFAPEAYAFGDESAIAPSGIGVVSTVVTVASMLGAGLPIKYVPLVGKVFDLLSLAVGRGENRWF